jgi:curved DNA-binding protein CbpA
MSKERGSGERPEQSKKRDYYDVLGVSKDADDQTLKSAYRKLAKQYHPDLNPGDKTAEEKFKDISEAYGILSDPQKRQAYNRTGVGSSTAPGSGGGFGQGFGFDDINFDDFDIDEVLRKAKARSGFQQRHERIREDIQEKARKTKEALEEVSRRLMAEIEEIYKDPVRNAERIKNFAAHREQKMRQATEDPDSILTGAKPKASSTQSHQETGRGEQRTHRQEPEQEPQSGRLKIKVSGSHYTLVDERGSSVSSWYKKIENKSGHFIGELSPGMCYLLDPETGQELNSSYRKIDVVNEAIIGYKSDTHKVLIDPNTGKELGNWYISIEVLDNKYAAGEFSKGMFYLVDRKTGNELSSSYKKIYKKGNKIIGFNGSWEDELRD